MADLSISGFIRPRRAPVRVTTLCHTVLTALAWWTASWKRVNPGINDCVETIRTSERLANLNVRSMTTSAVWADLQLRNDCGESVQIVHYDALYVGVGTLSTMCDVKALDF